MCHSHEKSESGEKTNVVQKWSTLVFMILRHLCFSVILLLLVVLFAYVSSKIHCSFVLEKIITFGTPTIMMLIFFILRHFALSNSLNGLMKKALLPFLRYFTFAVLFSCLAYLLLIFLNNSGFVFPINIAISLFISFIFVGFLLIAYMMIKAIVSRSRLETDKKKHGTRSYFNKKDRKKLMWIAIPIVIAAIIGFGADFLMDTVQRSGAKRNPYIIGEQITATEKDAAYGQGLPPNEDDILNVMLLSSEFERRKAEVVKFESAYDIHVQSYDVTSRSEEKLSPYVLFDDAGHNRYYIGGYFSLWMTNAFDYDIVVKKFTANATNIVVDKSPNIQIHGVIDDLAIDLYVYNAGWGPAYDVEVGISDIYNVFSSIWSSDSLGLSIPYLTPGETKIIRLISLPDLSNDVIRLISSYERNVYLNIYAKCKDDIRAQKSTSIAFSIIDGVFGTKYIVGMGAASQPVSYGILLQTNDRSFSFSYPTRDIIPAKKPVEFLSYLIADKSCEMSMQFELETSDGLVLKSPKYNNIRITVPYYDGNVPYNAENLSEHEKNNPDIVLFYPFEKNEIVH